MIRSIAYTVCCVPLLIATASAVQAQGSVNDAIKVIQSFQAGATGAAAAPVSFVPPPRTIKDITAILDQQKPDMSRRAAATASADRQPPAGMAGPELADFYYQRSLVAQELGRAQQYLDDAKKAYDVAAVLPNFPPPRLSVFVQTMCFAYRQLGDLRGAIECGRLRIQLAGRMEGGAAVVALLNSNQIIAGAALRLGQIEVAREALTAAERVAANLPQRMNQGTRDIMRVQALRIKALIALETGQYREAETINRQMLALTLPHVGQEQNIGMSTNLLSELRDIIYAELAACLLRQNRPIEAEAEIRRALLYRLSRNGRYASGTANTISALGRILFEQGRYAEAERLADAARDVYENLGHGKGSADLANARRLLAATQSAQDRTTDAQATYAALAGDIGDNAELRQQMLEANADYAYVLLQTGQAADAARIAGNVVESNRKVLGDKAFATAQARGWLAAALARQGQNDRATREFGESIEILLSSSRQAEDSDDDGSSVGQRDRQMQRIVEAYLGLLADTRGSAAAAETFRLADAVRGKSVQRALAASAARAAASDSELANLVRYEQDAQKQIAAFQGLLTNILTRPTAEQDAKAVQKLREDTDRLRTARARVREEIERRFPDYANLIDPKPATVEQAQKSLKPGEALIATYAGDERLFVWAVPAQGPAAFASSKISDKALEAMVTELRKALDPNASSIDEVPSFDVALANRLYDMLLRPVEAGWSSAKSLMVVPHKALGQLPTALLVTEKVAQPAKAGVPFAEYKGVPFLARKAAVTQLPSVTALATLRALPAPAASRETFIAFGDPWFSLEQASEARRQVAQAGALQTRGIPLIRRNVPKTDGVDSAELALLPRLPDTADEVKSIALALKADVSKDLFLGERANEKAVKEANLSGRKIVMFATHGLVPGDLNGLSQPALALTAPKVAGIDGDGLLTMEEILALKLNADWVVLSACNTASGSGAGAEAVSGLGRAFFYAGTRALLVSNWPVETGSARELTTDLFRRQAESAGLARGEAMRQAMVALIDGPGALDDAKKPLFSYAHPIFWAPFSVVGDGGG